MREDGKRIILYTKGADSVIYNRIMQQSVEESEASTRKIRTQTHLDQYARLGLRTLCMTRKVRGGDEVCGNHGDVC